VQEQSAQNPHRMVAMNEYLSAHYREVDSLAWETARLVVMERVPALP